MKNITIKFKITTLMIGIISIISIFYTLNIIYTVEKISAQNIKQIKEEAYLEKKSELLNYSQMAYEIVNSYYTRSKKGNTLSDIDANMKREAIHAIRNLRYGKNGYFWINSMNNRMIVHPIKPEYDGEIFVNTPEVPFVELGTKKLKSSTKNSDYIEYSFYTPDTKKYSHKLSIVTRFKPWDWVIGTGVYTDYIDAKVEELTLRTKKDIDSLIVKNTLISLATILVFIFIILYVSNKLLITPIHELQRGLKSFFDYLQDSKKEVSPISIDTKDELGEMGRSINESINISMKMNENISYLIHTIDKNVIISEVDSFGVITNVSEAFCKISGFKKEELTGKHYDTLRYPEFSRAIYEDIRDDTKAIEIWEGEVQNIKKDGSFYWVNMVATPRYDTKYSDFGFTAIYYDITSKKDIEKLNDTMSKTNIKIKQQEIK